MTDSSEALDAESTVLLIDNADEETDTRTCLQKCEDQALVEHEFTQFEILQLGIQDEVFESGMGWDQRSDWAQAIVRMMMRTQERSSS